MAFSNDMTRLLNKIENRLGLKPLNLPDDICKDKWASEVIENDTIPTFSRYFPRQFNYLVEPNTHPKKNGWYLLDESIISPDTKILGVKDINWSDFGQDTFAYHQNMGWGTYDYLMQSYGIEDISLAQMRADHMSLFNNGIYVEFDPPNRFRLQSATGADMSRSVGKFHILILLEHRHDLTTISPTQMETFEDLAQADIARFLYRYLVHYDQLETVYLQIDLKLSELENEASKREEIINTIKEGYVSAANANQPYIITV